MPLHLWWQVNKHLLLHWTMAQHINTGQNVACNDHIQSNFLNQAWLDIKILENMLEQYTRRNSTRFRVFICQWQSSWRKSNWCVQPSEYHNLKICGVFFIDQHTHIYIYWCLTILPKTEYWWYAYSSTKDHTVLSGLKIRTFHGVITLLNPPNTGFFFPLGLTPPPPPPPPPNVNQFTSPPYPTGRCQSMTFKRSEFQGADKCTDTTFTINIL